MWISTAFAQAAGAPAPGGGDLLMSFLPFILIGVIFWFLLIRPQQKRMKEHRNMLDAIRRGDKVVTGGGIIGSVVHADENELNVEIADGVKVKVMRGTITNVLAKTEPTEAEAPKADKDTAAAEGKSGGMLGGLFGSKKS